jgi:hypothetical protein
MLGLSVVLVLATPTRPAAFQILGQVVNGTTGQAVGSATIRVVNPSGGMLVENEVQTMDDLGRFKVDDLSEDVSAYLLRVTYQGVSYTEMIRYDGKDPHELEIRVYELTDSWDNIHVDVPHVMVARSADTLTVQKSIQIRNHTTPPKTVYGTDARFALYLPEDRIALNELSVTSLGIPLPMNPTPTDDPGLYTIDYPIKPGETTIQVSFDLPYGNGSYTYTEPLQYDIGEMLIITQDPTINVTSATTEVGQAEDFHGFKSYPLADLSADQPLTLTFSGGGASPGSAPQIRTVPDQTRNIAISIMIVLSLTLVLFLFSVTSKGHSAAMETEVLKEQKEQLLSQLARLDDLHKAGTVSDQMYKLKRTELMNSLAEIYYRTDFDRASEPDAATNEEPGEKGAARV